mgnify:CR=1 FL=1
MVSGHQPELARETDEIEFTAEATFSDREAFHAKDFEQMTAAEREREDAKREGIEIKGGVMPLEVASEAEAATPLPI